MSYQHPALVVDDAQRVSNVLLHATPQVALPLSLNDKMEGWSEIAMGARTLRASDKGDKGSVQKAQGHHPWERHMVDVKDTSG